MSGEGLLLNRIRIVLVSPSHAGNVGSCARALKTMGLSQLWLVSPRREGVTTDPEAIALSSGATDVLAAARTVSSLSDALAGCGWVLATSSRERELGPPLLDAPEAVEGLVRQMVTLPDSFQGAIVFGCERTGLSNDDLLRADVHAMIPANPDYASLNLSQAVQLLCWEVRKTVLAAARGSTPAAPVDPAGLPVDSPAIERLFEHWLKAMTAVDFLNPDKPKRLVPRLRRMLQRARLESGEVDMLHGFLSDVIRISQGRWYRAEWNALTEEVARARERYGAAETGSAPLRPEHENGNTETDV